MMDINDYRHASPLVQMAAAAQVLDQLRELQFTIRDMKKQGVRIPVRMFIADEQVDYSLDPFEAVKLQGLVRLAEWRTNNRR